MYFRPLSYLLVWLLCSQAGAVLNFTLYQYATDVVLEVEGSVNLSGLDFEAVGVISASINPGEGSLGATSGAVWGYSGMTGPDNFGSGTSIGATNFDGDVVGILGGYGLLVPENYDSGDPIAAQAVWELTTLAELGVTPGTYEYTWSGDSVILTIVPEPAYSGLGIGFAMAGLLIWRCRRKVGEYSA
ncbi:hypothetical protein [Cerasicoccus frondis]|uniref:hypothetical protein n=1 Tax=Cerasicoccus frondis TaxID=490090 RepID=UPI002852C3FC|nr:hypothetical protein [Cerasicoccus frondis]